MRLESALYASREGLNVHGQAIAVISDNISNAGTTAFKTSRAEFSDMFNAGVGSKDSEPLANGGGARVGSIRTLIDPAESESTGRPLDVAITGSGFFMVGDTTNPLYTRAGNFRVDQGGNLVTMDGRPVLGLPAGDTTGALGPINILDVNTEATPTGAVTMRGNLSSRAPITTPIDAPASFSEIAQSGAETQFMDVYDSLGEKHTVMLAFTKTASDGGTTTWTARAYMEGADTGGQPGVPVLVGQTAGLRFQADGSIAPEDVAGAQLNIATPYANGAAAAAFSIDFSNYTQNANPSDLKAVTQDGKSAGTVKGYQIDKNGAVIATLSSGEVVEVARIQLANFVNLDGLTRLGGNYYAAGADTGERTVGNPGDGSLGGLQAGALERSSTDVSGEFVNLVVYQRGYQANSQILSAASQILRDTISLIR